jgi:drug/metabolite transporter (DMT)-like permease
VADRLDARGAALAVGLTMLWGGSYTAMKLGFRDLPVFGSLVLRVVVATPLLFACTRLIGAPLLYRGPRARFVAIHAAAFVWSQLFLYLGLAETTAGRAAVLFNTQPFLTLLVIPFFVPSERFTARRMTGTAVAFVGVVLVFLDRLGGGSLRGDVLILVGMTAWTVMTIVIKVMPPDVPAVSVMFWSVALTLPTMAAVTALREPHATWRLTPTAVGSVLYLGGVIAAFSFAAFMWLLRRHSAVRVNAFVFLSPVFGVLIGWLVLGETLSPLQAAGALGVAAGILVVNTGG